MRGPLTSRGWAAVGLTVLALGAVDGWHRHLERDRERRLYFSAGYVAGECRVFRDAARENPILLPPNKPEVREALQACAKVHR